MLQSAGERVETYFARAQSLVCLEVVRLQPLTAGLAGPTTIGLLGSLRDVVCEVDRLDDVIGALTIACERLSHDRAGSIYAFEVAAEADGRVLLRGRATVVQRGTDAS